MNVLSVHQFDQPQLEEIFGRAEHFGEQLASSSGRRAIAAEHIGETLINLFYEPSTRTRISFGMAASHLGMSVEGTENAEIFSSAAKGETLEDTIRVLNEYDPSVIVLRHPETGSANRAAAVSDVPIINAGDGMGEHPTQALLDLFTIKEAKERLDDLHIVIGGDLVRGRTARSLAQLLALFANNRISFVSLPNQQIGEDVKEHLSDHKLEYEETVDMHSALRTADVVYWTRLQKERVVADAALDVVEPDVNFTINQAALEVLPADSIIMHPLPRVGEITPDVDNDPRAVYFRQAGNGMYVRMALLDIIINDTLD